MNNSQETASVMSACGPRITQYAGSPENKEMLKAFFLTLQVTHYLSCGMTKTVKPFLRQLQECIANLSTAEGGSHNECWAQCPFSSALFLLLFPELWQFQDHSKITISHSNRLKQVRWGSVCLSLDSFAWLVYPVAEWLLVVLLDATEPISDWVD